MSELPLSERVLFDDQSDILMINDVKITGALLEALSTPTKDGLWFRVIKCENGISIVHMIDSEKIQLHLLQALQQIATGRIIGDEGNHEATIAVMRKIAGDAVDTYFKETDE